MSDDGGSDPAEKPSWRAELRVRLGRLSIAMTTGLLCGLLIGGVGGRLAMFVLRLTSDDRLKGVKTDDDFVIGQFSSGSFFLIGLTTIAGGFLGAAYLLVRGWLPETRRRLWTGALTALVGGALIVKPHGIDFTQLDPLALAIVLFVVLPGAYGYALSAIAERRLRVPTPAGRRSWLSVLPAVPFLVLGPPGAIVLIVFACGFLIHLQAPWLARLPRTSLGMALGRGLLLAIAVVAAIDLVRDSAEIL